MPGRGFYSTNSYRYGFNSKENDNEVKGEGNQQDYGFRIYDPRLSKFLSVDPLTIEYPMLTPYQFASNRPIDGIDLDGLEWKSAADNLWNGVKQNYNNTVNSLSPSSLKRTAKDILGTAKDAANMAIGKKGAAESFNKRVMNFSTGLSNSISEPVYFFATMHKRTLNENAFGIGYYGFQIALTILPEVWAEASSIRAGMAASYEGNSIIRNAIADGVEFRIATTADEIRYLDVRKAQATYATDLNNPAGVVTLRKGFGRADILEESIHAQQRKLYGEEYFNDNLYKFEIEAQNKLLEIGKREKWPDAEIDKIKKAKIQYEKLKKDNE